MTEYKLQCRQADGDYLIATRPHASTSVRVVAFDGYDESMRIFADPANARTFARGILALADEIDGGETPATEEPLKVGDSVVIVREYDDRTGHVDGKPGTIVRLDPQDPRFPYRVRLYEEDVWVHEVRKIADAPTVAPPADAPVKIGDKVRVTVANLGGYDVSYGDVLTVTRVWEQDGSVDTRGDNGTVRWFRAARLGAGLERVDEKPAAAPAVADATRLALLNEARDLVGLDAPLSDVVAVARFLAGE
jgi:hypothetical protein